MLSTGLAEADHASGESAHARREIGLSETKMTGETISHYRVLEKLGDGATAEVYKAEDLALCRPVAVKLVPRELSADLGMVARFQHEARTASSLNHPNICTIYEIAEHEGRFFIVMELLDGKVLSKVIGGRPLAMDRILEIGIQIADALDAAHAGASCTAISSQSTSS